jgi:hypothetical protein
MSETTARCARGHADLRMALRDIPILPAPTTIEDLVARLDQTASGASAALAQIVHDARSERSSGPKQGHRKLVGQVHSRWRTAASKVRVGPGCPQLIMAFVLIGGAVLVPTTSRRDDRALLVSPTAHASNEIVSSSTPQDFGRSGEAPSSLSTRVVHSDPLSRVGYVSNDTLYPAPRTPPKKIRTSRPHTPRGRQTADRRYASFPAGLACRVAKMLLLRCTVRS